MRQPRRFLIPWMAFAVLAVSLTLSTCDCPFYYAAIARVRLLNGGAAGPHFAHFYFYPHRAPQNPEDALASGLFWASEGEEYARREGEIYVFQTEAGSDGYDVHIFVDADDDGGLSAGDQELLVTNLIMTGSYVVEVDYLGFTAVD